MHSLSTIIDGVVNNIVENGLANCAFVQLHFFLKDVSLTTPDCVVGYFMLIVRFFSATHGRESMSVVVDHQEKITPKSVLRHRPIGTKQEIVPITLRSSRLKKKEHAMYATSGLPSLANKTIRKPKQHDRVHWLVSVGLTMATTVVLILVLQILLAWGTTTFNDLRYGKPRTFQIDMVVGHGDSAAHPTHLVALNLRGHIEILELPGGNVSHARILVGPTLSGNDADLVPVTLQFVDRQGNHHPDMLVRCGAIELWFNNENGMFVVK